MNLPSQSVDSLFARMQIRYGSGWTRMWEGVDIAAVKAEWAYELGGVPSEAILYALEYMPHDKPPTVKQFATLCHRAPTPNVARLPAPKPTDADKERVRKMMAGLRQKMAMRKVVA